MAAAAVPFPPPQSRQIRSLSTDLARRLRGEQWCGRVGNRRGERLLSVIIWADYGAETRSDRRGDERGAAVFAPTRRFRVWESVMPQFRRGKWVRRR